MLREHLAAFLRPHPVAVRLALLLLASATVAENLNGVVALWLRPSADGLGYVSPAVTHKTAGVVDAELAAIAGRNLLGALREAHDDPSARPSPATVLGPCRSTEQVRATLVAAGLPEWSVALLASGGGPAEVYSINVGSNALGPDVTLVESRDCAVVLQRGDSLELCACETDGMIRLPSPPAARVEPRSDGITRLSAMAYEVDRRLVETALADLPRIATQVHLVPLFVRDELVGLSVRTLRPDSIVARLGLQRGDLIESIDGRSVHNPDDMLELYQRLRNVSSLSLQIRRANRSQTLSYAIR